MSGLVTQTRQKGRGSGLTQGFTFHRFTATYSNWPKPYGCTMIIIECIGAGGGGGLGGLGGRLHGGGLAFHRLDGRFYASRGRIDGVDGALVGYGEGLGGSRGSRGRNHGQ